MFMDPGAFETEDLERELAEAGIGPESAVTTRRSVEDAAGTSELSGGLPYNKGAPVDASSLTHLSGSGYGLGPGGKVPRALTEDGRQHTPTYGRHSNKGTNIRSSKSRQQMAPPSSTPPPGTFSEISAVGSRGGKEWAGADAKFSEESGAIEGNSANSNGGSAGSNSRARVLAQQREIERKRRQQALSAGGIRASDAASLSRGVVSSADASGIARGQRRSSAGGLSAAAATGGDKGLTEGTRNDGGGGVEDNGHGFSPAVKQFSAPRQVESDGYTAFNPNKPGTERTTGLSEFDRRRSSGHGDVLGDTDSDEHSERSRRRRHRAASPDDLDNSEREDGANETETTVSTTVVDQTKSGDSNREHGLDKRAGDWDDRHRPSSTTYKWGHDSNGDDGRGLGSESGAWRSVGRDKPLSDDEAENGNRKSRHRSRSKTRFKVRPKHHWDDEQDDQDSGGPKARSSYLDRDRVSDQEHSSEVSSDHSASSSTSPPRHGRHRRPRHDRRGSHARHRDRSNATPTRTGGKSRRGDSEDDGKRISSGRRARDKRHDDSSDSRGKGGGSRRRRSSNSRHARRWRDTDTNQKSDIDHENDHSSDGDEIGRYKIDRRASGRDKMRPRGGRRSDDDAGSSREIGREQHEENRSEMYQRGERQEDSGKEREPADEEEKKTEDRDGNGARQAPGGGRGNDSQVPAPRDGFSSKGSGNGSGSRNGDGASGNTPVDGGEVEFNMAAIDLSEMKRFLMSPCPRAAGVVQCYIRRNKTRAYKLFPEYSLFMKEGDRFLMCSKKRPNNATSNYLVSMRAGDLDRNSTNFLGKLRANFVGTEFQVFDDGFNPREPGTFALSKTLGGGGGGNIGDDSKRPMRKELGCVLYASNVLGSRGPRKMQVAIPAVSEDGTPTEWNDLDVASTNNNSKAIERVKNRDYDGSLYMVNKPPRWNDQVGAYVLNFYGRVTMASVKNFQLVSTEDFDRIILQFGRVAKDEFTMDFQLLCVPIGLFLLGTLTKGSIGYASIEKLS